MLWYTPFSKNISIGDSLVYFLGSLGYFFKCFMTEEIKNCRSLELKRPWRVGNR